MASTTELTAPDSHITSNQIRQKLKDHLAILNQEFKVHRIGIFGSYARDQATTDSDIDVLVEFREPIGWEFVDLQNYLEEILRHRVDLVTVRALKPQLKDFILSDVIYI